MTLYSKETEIKIEQMELYEENASEKRWSVSSRKSASRWNVDSERALLRLWFAHMEQLRGCRKNRHIIQEMMNKMHNQGYYYTVDELKTKMHNVSARYKREKQAIEATGSTSDWEIFNDVDRLLDPDKSFNPDDLPMEHINNLETPLTNNVSNSRFSTPPLTPFMYKESSSELPSTSNVFTVPKEEDNLTQVFTDFENRIEGMYDEIKKLVKIEEEKKDILKSFVDREADVQKALIDFLKKS
ncbi:uncharacterized protein LOC105261878 isoform X2 [Musca domestica]|uniref:Uncharacterized protein LOC105261878 isoform X2 n=1 Tax=Musca domestica TaxID=7370 RepID=A0ABM3V3P6_MUSDO|nr:uncharacterized protein LOC105261878 isoform X2 [Musca domestica]